MLNFVEALLTFREDIWFMRSTAKHERGALLFKSRMLVLRWARSCVEVLKECAIRGLIDSARTSLSTRKMLHNKFDHLVR